MTVSSGERGDVLRGTVNPHRAGCDGIRDCDELSMGTNGDYNRFLHNLADCVLLDYSENRKRHSKRRTWLPQTDNIVRSRGFRFHSDSNSRITH